MTDSETEARDAQHGFIKVQRTPMITVILAFTIVFCLITLSIVKRQYDVLSAVLSQVVAHSPTQQARPASSSPSSPCPPARKSKGGADHPPLRQEAEGCAGA